MKNWIINRPWIWIALFFVTFMAVWAWFVVIAIQNSPETVPLQSSKFQHES